MPKTAKQKQNSKTMRELRRRSGRSNRQKRRRGTQSAKNLEKDLKQDYNDERMHSTVSSRIRMCKAESVHCKSAHPKPEDVNGSWYLTPSSFKHLIPVYYCTVGVLVRIARGG